MNKKIAINKNELGTNEHDIKYLESAMDILVEGYKRVSHGQKNVTLQEVLEAVNITRGKDHPQKESEIELTEEEAEEVYNSYKESEITTESDHRLPSIKETVKVRLHL
jgi:hypothetical protein